MNVTAPLSLQPSRISNLIETGLGHVVVSEHNEANKRSKTIHLYAFTNDGTFDVDRSRAAAFHFNGNGTFEYSSGAEPLRSVEPQKLLEAIDEARLLNGGLCPMANRPHRWTQTSIETLKGLGNFEGETRCGHVRVTPQAGGDFKIQVRGFTRDGTFTPDDSSVTTFDFDRRGTLVAYNQTDANAERIFNHEVIFAITQAAAFDREMVPHAGRPHREKQSAVETLRKFNSFNGETSLGHATVLPWENGVQISLKKFADDGTLAADAKTYVTYYFDHEGKLKGFSHEDKRGCQISPSQLVGAISRALLEIQSGSAQEDRADRRAARE